MPLKGESLHYHAHLRALLMQLTSPSVKLLDQTGEGEGRTSGSGVEGTGIHLKLACLRVERRNRKHYPLLG